MVKLCGLGVIIYDQGIRIVLNRQKNSQQISQLNRVKKDKRKGGKRKKT